MSFQEQEQTRLAAHASETWGASTHVIPYDVASETLQADVRESALAYFARHQIKWWTSRWDARTSDMELRPTGHLTSSQVACVNHLEPARVDRAVAEMVLGHLEPGLRPLALDDGYVEYEWIGRENYLGERASRTRGANVTSLDALMLAQRDEQRVLIAIEWKYLESPKHGSVAVSTRGVDRVETYRSLLERPDCPILIDDLSWLFYEPYYQLMRQTLLAWQMVEHGEFEARDWLHVYVVPAANKNQRERGGAPPQLVGETMMEVWQSLLREPGRYRVLTPTDLLAGMGEPEMWTAWRRWLAQRYLT